MIQEKLIKFATRVPVFMYLTDYREYSLQDVITQLEPELFKKVTGLDVKDFELLVSLNVFNEALMNDAVYKFKRYEDASLIYTGIDKHTGENVGLYSTVISRADYDAMAGQLAASMTADAPRDDDLPERPVFTNISSYDFDDEEDELPKVAEPKAKYETKRKPLVGPSKPVSTPTYRPSYAVPGECVRFRIGIRNMSSETFRNLTLRDVLPTGLSYINGSTRIYNAKHPQGVTLSDNIITDMGVNIGDYAPGANAWIYFDTVTPEMASNENIIYRNIIQACGGYGSKEKSADVIVDACEA